MRLFIASDLHGSAYYTQKMLQRYSEEKADMMLLLGDLLYHGPRNDLPEGYDTKKTAELLNSVRHGIIWIQGNCDAEVDQMVLSFPMHREMAFESKAGTVLATHGHVYNDEKPPYPGFDGILLCGHTHVCGFKEADGYLYMNPGSISIPKDGTPHSYMITDMETYTIKDLDGNIIRSMTVI
ncbi:MAG: phosphodiesterase [Eubacteriaceae bacterium]|nr:phosphodiesterase [Eubacteriaceae bacterium]